MPPAGSMRPLPVTRGVAGVAPEAVVAVGAGGGRYAWPSWSAAAPAPKPTAKRTTGTTAREEPLRSGRRACTAEPRGNGDGLDHAFHGSKRPRRTTISTTQAHGLRPVGLAQ